MADLVLCNIFFFFGWAVNQIVLLIRILAYNN